MKPISRNEEITCEVMVFVNEIFVDNLDHEIAIMSTSKLYFFEHGRSPKVFFARSSTVTAAKGSSSTPMIFSLTMFFSHI